MNKVNMGDKYTHRITLRVNDDQFGFLTSMSEMLGVTPSDYIRMAVNTSMVAMKKNTTLKGMVGTANENVETDFNDQL